jgi:GT2 family glycosyltransferase
MTPLSQVRSTTVSLIISSLNEGEELHETLKSVFAGTVIPAQTIIVDDGSSDGSCEALQRDSWRAQGVVVHRIERSGIAAARNVGGKLATGTHLVFLDAHCRVDAHCFAELNTAMTDWRDAILAPSLCDVGSTVYGCGARLIDPELRVRWLSPAAAKSASCPVPIAPGGCLAVSRAIFERLGGFGAFRELGQEDVEFSLRAWRAGVDVLTVPSARLSHRFRPYPSYLLSSTSRAYNVARVALIHFQDQRREQCLRKIIGTPRAAEALVDALTSDWEDQSKAVAAISVRPMEAFFEKFGGWE